MDATTVSPNDAEYPRGVADLPDRPNLRVRGVLPQREGVTIVGTRVCSQEGELFAQKLAADLARAGFAIWSGGAFGIDCAAHRGALEAEGSTVVVIGSGLDNPTPPEHSALFDEVVRRGGAIVSREDDDALAARPQYHARNAILAAATPLTVVVECPLRSGALSTARRARALGRKLAFVPHAPWTTSGAGCVLEIQQGAALVTGLDDVLRLLGVLVAPTPPGGLTGAPRSIPRASKRQTSLFASSRNAPIRQTVSLDSLSTLERRIHDSLETPLHIDVLCDRLAETVTVLVPAIFGLILTGVLAEDAPNVFRRAS